MKALPARVAPVFSCFLTFESGLQDGASDQVGPQESLLLRALLERVPFMLKGEILLPAQGVESYHKDGPAPALTLQLDFPALEPVEAALLNGGVLHRAREEHPDIFGRFHVSVQVMYKRPFLQVSAYEKSSQTQNPCCYLVHYPGHAENMNDWLCYYLSHHPDIMRSYPEIREIDVFTRVDAISGSGWLRNDYMQRNKLSFPSPEALEAALYSPVRNRMREDARQFPPFSGGSVHHALRQQIVWPSRS